VFFFSIHPNREAVGQHGLTSRGFTVKVVQNMKILGDYVTKFMNSPVIWKCGIRKGENFAWAQFAVLDVDDGLALRDAVKHFEPYLHLIGTTKSHQKLKGNKVADRFRVFVALNERTKQAEEYLATNVKLALELGGDVQACGAHMSFMPLTEIISLNERGKRLDIELPSVNPQHIHNSNPKRLNATYSGRRQIPNYIQRWLQFGAPEGERNITCFKAACGLLKAGFFEDEVINMLIDSAIPISRSEDISREIRQTVRSAARKWTK
jgi:hypothetical protein